MLRRGPSLRWALGFGLAAVAWLARGDWAPEGPADFALDAPSPVRTSTAVWPSVAFDGQRFWAVYGTGTPPAGIWGTRLDEAGQVLDAPGKPLAAEDRYTAPAIAGWNGQSLVAWTAIFPDAGRAVRAVRLDSDGGVLDATPLAIAGVPAEIVPGGVGAGDAGYLVAWQRSTGDGGSTVAVTRVTRDGTVLDANGLPTPATAPVQSGAAVTGSGGDLFLAAWAASTADGGTEIEASRFSFAGGGALETVHIDLGDTGQAKVDQLAATFDGQGFWVAWTGRLVSVGRVDTNGNALDLPAGIPLAASDGGTPAVALAPEPGGGVLVAFDLKDTTFTRSLVGGARVTAGGTPVDTAPLVLWASSAEPLAAHGTVQVSLAQGNTADLLAWQMYLSTVELDWALRFNTGSSWSNSPWIAAARRFPDGGLPDPQGLRLMTWANWELEPAVAASASQYFAAWSDTRGHDGEQQSGISGGRVAFDGRVLDYDSLALSTKIFSMAPAVGSDGTDFLVAWTESPAALVVEGTNAGIRGVRVSAAGQALDATPLAISPASGPMQHPRIAFDGTRYVVAWLEAGYNLIDDTTVASPHVRLVSPDGTMAPEGPPLASTRGTGLLFFQTLALDTAFDGQLVWVGWQSPLQDGGLALELSRLDGAGAPLDSPPIELVSGALEEGPALASRGDGVTLVAWTERDQGGGGLRLLAARMASDGGVLDPGGLEIAQGPVSTVRALAEHSGYFVAWDDSTNPLSPVTQARWLDLRGRLHPEDGGAALPAGPADSGSTYAGPSSFAADGHGHVLRVFSRVDPTPGVLSPRVRASLVTLPDAGVDPPLKVGCGCQGGNGPAALGLALLLLIRTATSNSRLAREPRPRGRR